MDSFEEYDRASKKNGKPTKRVTQETGIVDSSGRPYAPNQDYMKVRQTYEDPGREPVNHTLLTIIISLLVLVIGFLAWDKFGGLDAITGGKNRSLNDQYQELKDRGGSVTKPKIKYVTKWKTKTKVVEVKDKAQAKEIRRLKERVQWQDIKLNMYRKKVAELQKERTADENYMELMRESVRSVYNRPMPAGMGSRELCFTTDETNDDCIYVKRKRKGDLYHLPPIEDV